MERRWSKARRLALEAFFTHNGRARRSNTTDSIGTAALAYWQSVDWLEAEGLVERAGPDAYRLTEAGWDAGGQLWHVPAVTLRRMKSKAT
jgi:hypothetical protein